MASTLPDQLIPNEKKDKKWYIENIKAYSASFNAPRSLMSSTEYRNPGASDRPVDDMIRMFRYYLGKQDNKDYYYTNCDEDEQPLNTVWIPGQKVTQLVDHLMGKAIEMFENIEPETKATSRDAVNRKTKLLEMAMLRFEAPKLMEAFNEAGMELAPLGDKSSSFGSQEELHRYMEYDYKEYGEKLAAALVEDIMMRNKHLTLFKRAFFYTLIGGLAGFENYVHNGKQYIDAILPYQAIIDTGVDDDFNSKARYGGRITWLTPSEVIAKYRDLSPEDADELKKVTSNNYTQILSIDGSDPGLVWAYTEPSGQVVMAEVTMYWKGYKDLRYDKRKDKYGNEHYAKMRAPGNSEYWTETVYKGKLIAGKYLVQYGECENIVRSTDNPSDCELPIRFFMPNMALGMNRSIVMRLHQHQDRIDYITNEVTKMLNRNKGKNYVFYENRLGESLPKDILNDFSRMGIHVAKGMDLGEDTSIGDKKGVETVDMTLDPNINVLVGLRREEERIMEEIVNLPKIALGQQSGYVGARTQAGTIAQSDKGTSYLYSGFIYFIESTLRHALNQYKLALPYESEDEIPVVGTRGKNWMKITKDFQFEEMGIYFTIKDFIDEKARERLLAYAQAAMQNQQISFLDAIRIEKAKTYTELLNELEFALKQTERKQAEQQQLAAMMQQVQLEQQAAGQENLEATRQEGENYRKELQVGAEMAQQQPNLEV